MSGDEVVVPPIPVREADAVDFFKLTGRQILVWIETPASGEQPLAVQNLVQPCDASGKPVAGIEECRVGIGQRCGPRQNVVRAVPFLVAAFFYIRDQLYRTARPHSPLAEQAAGEM